MDLSKCGPEVHEREAKEKRIEAAENMIRSLPHYNNEVRRLTNEIEATKLKLDQLKNKNIKRKTFGGSIEGSGKYEINLAEIKRDLKLYKCLVNKVDGFLELQVSKDKQALIDLFINNKTYDNVAKSFPMTGMGLHKRVKSLLSKFY